ncbi:thiamine pyrophosphate-dependent enzyme [Thermosulfuriphilus sp.]
MKHVGLNVAADALMTLAYIGVKGGMVIITADDPSMHSSQNEQDNRFYAKLSGLPMLEPIDPQEAKEMTVFAFELSERLELPVLLRTTTRTSHVRAPVTLGPLPKEVRKRGEFVKDPKRFVPVPAVARVRHQILLERGQEAQIMADGSRFNEIIGQGPLGIITSGVAVNYVLDAVEELGLKDKVSILKLGFTHPWPVGLIADFLKKVEVVLVVEELEAFLEEAARILAQEREIKVSILGKATGHLPRLYEFNPAIVRKAIAEAAGLEAHGKKRADLSWIPELPPRPPTLCPGCPHRETYLIIKEALKDLGEEAIYPTDIGCYTLGLLPPIQMADYLICMGSSVGSACGFSAATQQRIISFIGDSTFFHAGIPPLVNAVYNQHRFTLVVLDNETTAMTGHQPTPSQDLMPPGYEHPKVSIEEVCRAIGVREVVTINPYRKEEALEAVKELLKKDELSVLVSRAPCILYARRFRSSK